MHVSLPLTGMQHTPSRHSSSPSQHLHFNIQHRFPNNDLHTHTTFHSFTVQFISQFVLIFLHQHLSEHSETPSHSLTQTLALLFSLFVKLTQFCWSILSLNWLQNTTTRHAEALNFKCPHSHTVPSKLIASFCCWCTAFRRIIFWNTYTQGHHLNACLSMSGQLSFWIWCCLSTDFASCSFLFSNLNPQSGQTLLCHFSLDIQHHCFCFSIPSSTRVASKFGGASSNIRPVSTCPNQSCGVSPPSLLRSIQLAILSCGSKH